MGVLLNVGDQYRKDKMIRYNDGRYIVSDSNLN